MQPLYRGKTKDMYAEGPDALRLLFTDRVTRNDAGEIDPGGNRLAEHAVPGQGAACLAMSGAIFAELEAKKAAHTHMISFDLAALTMIVRKAVMFKPGLEWIARWVCTGSFLRRYAMAPGVRDGLPLAAPVFEITLKDDAAGDPLIVPSALVGLGIVPQGLMDALLAVNAETMRALHGMFAARGLDLWDIKIEWGLDGEGRPMLIDEVSPGCCRAFRADTRERVAGMELAGYFRG